MNGGRQAIREQVEARFDRIEEPTTRFSTIQRIQARRTASALDQTDSGAAHPMLSYKATSDIRHLQCELPLAIRHDDRLL
jgi:hypothetical protein